MQVLEKPVEADVAHWTGVTFQGWLRDELEVDVGYSTVIRFLHEQGFTWTVPQPWPDRQDEKKRAEFREKLKERASDPEVELWFSDEMGVEGDPQGRRQALHDQRGPGRGAPAALHREKAQASHGPLDDDPPG